MNTTLLFTAPDCPPLPSRSPDSLTVFHFGGSHRHSHRSLMLRSRQRRWNWPSNRCPPVRHLDLMGWEVASYKDISLESLSLFHLLVPKIEILVLGTGDRVERLDPAIARFMRQKGVAMEIQDTVSDYILYTSDR
ncbi:hypothetical protein GDO81_021336 [Engystomops pustulosus]|uniref:NADH dehydrogenase [ubiquinone] 1 alpha subcomplex assembly factor 3 n=1 Tax=Engystomops pustulosus TaxID=76066 RepID=A0AAV6YTM3_ENGPU|nr:hypothetical protein GDO81_021336 [Engystomops pustulosus]